MLSPKTRLRRAVPIAIELKSQNVRVREPQGPWVTAPFSVLRLLEAFATPKTVDEALGQIATEDRQTWIELSALVVELTAAGVLVSPEGQTARTPGRAALEMHLSLLADRTRTEAYLAAIAEVVRPGDRVIDLGTGTGVLALAAARAGAQRVHAIEAHAVADLARSTFAANEVGDRVELVEAWSGQVELPEKADVLISEIIGNAPLAEGVLEHTKDAVERLLRPGGRLVPRVVSVFAQPWSLKPALFSQFRPTPESIETFATWYGLDFSSLLEAKKDPVRAVLSSEELAGSRPVGPAQRILRVDLAEPPQMVDTRAQLTFDQAGDFNAVVLSTELELSESQRLRIEPGGPTSSWRFAVWLADAPRAAHPGDAVDVRYQHTGVATRLEIQPNDNGDDSED